MRPTLADKMRQFAPGPYRKIPCVLWQGYCNAHGYGVVYHQGKRTLAHVIQAALHGIEKLPHQRFTHTCKTPSCVNPRHLVAKSLQDIQRDRNKPSSLKRQRKRATKVIIPQAAPRAQVKVRRCEICQAVLAQWSYKRRFCSTACRRQTRRGVIRSCQWCQTSFECPVGLRYRSVYCSAMCKRAYFQVHLETYARAKASRVYFRQCAVCGGAFFATAKRKERKSCSDVCAKELITKRNRATAKSRSSTCASR